MKIRQICSVICLSIVTPLLSEVIDRTATIHIPAGETHILTSVPPGTTPIRSVEAGVEIEKGNGMWEMVLIDEKNDTMRVSIDVVEINKGDFDQYDILKIGVTVNGETTYIGKRSKGVALHRGTNYLKAQLNTDGLTLSIGRRTLSRFHTQPGFSEITRAYLISRSNITIKRTVIGFMEERLKPEPHIATTPPDPYDGCTWSFIDHVIDPAYSRRGGDYRLKTVKTGNGYDIIYLSGAVTCPANWNEGDIKGRLKESPAPGSYDLIWVGSQLDTDYTDAQGRFEGEMLILTFPYDKATLRFIRTH